MRLLPFVCLCSNCFILTADSCRRRWREGCRNPICGYIDSQIRKDLLRSDALSELGLVWAQHLGYITSLT